MLNTMMHFGHHKNNPQLIINELNTINRLISLNLVILISMKIKGLKLFVLFK